VNKNGSRLRHGDARTGRYTRLYRIFRGIVQRCNDANAPIYKYYGARGIRCLWSCYEDFKRDMEPTYEDNLSIGRIDNDGHYCKENCQWETRAQQARNYSRNVFLTWNGKTQCVTDWGNELGIDHKTISKRLKLGWSVNDALGTAPLNGKAIQFNGQTRTIAEWSRIVNVPVTAIYARLDRGWSVEDSLTTPVKTATAI
jgi:hypothetical protein